MFRLQQRCCQNLKCHTVLPFFPCITFLLFSSDITSFQCKSRNVFFLSKVINPYSNLLSNCSTVHVVSGCHVTLQGVWNMCLFWSLSVDVNDLICISCSVAVYKLFLMFDSLPAQYAQSRTTWKWNARLQLVSTKTDNSCVGIFKLKTKTIFRLIRFQSRSYKNQKRYWMLFDFGLLRAAMFSAKKSSAWRTFDSRQSKEILLPATSSTPAPRHPEPPIHWVLGLIPPT